MNKIIVFGTGRTISSELSTIQMLGFSVDYFVDNDSRKWNTLFFDKIVKSPLALLEEKCRRTIVIGSELYKQQIIEQLIDLGVYYDNDCIGLDDFEMKYFINEHIHLPMCESTMDNSLSILFDSQAFSMQRRGGISRYYYEIIRRLVKNIDISVDFYEGLNDNIFDFSDIAPLLNSFYSENCSYSNISLLSALNARLIRDFSEGKKYKIYNPTYYAEYGVRNYDNLIITVYDMIHELYHLDEHTEQRKKRIINHADGIIAISNSTKNDLVNMYNIDPDIVNVVYLANSLDYEIDEPPVIEQKYILYVGNRNDYKNAELLFYAFSRCEYINDVCLVFMGGGDFNAKEKALMLNLGIHERVIHISGDDKQLANLYKFAEVFVYPSKYEGFGLPILEAMHYGTPVITSNSSSMSEISGDAAVLFDPESEESLTDAINKVLRDSVFRMDMGKRGLKHEKHFSWDKSAAQIYDFYKKFN